jgi:hypothetical protein
MNELYKAKDKDTPQVPPTLPLPKPLPKLPPVSYELDFMFGVSKGQLIIIMLLMAITIGVLSYFLFTPDPDNLSVYCQPPLVNAWRPTINNNMQATHTYLEDVSTKDTQICIKADDYGTLYGSSMQPTFFEGNTILLKNYTENMTLKTGDIIRFFRFTPEHPNCTSLQNMIANNSLGGSWVRNDMAVIHRVNAVYDMNILAQGDNLYEQEDLQRCQITDVAVAIIFT